MKEKNNNKYDFEKDVKKALEVIHREQELGNESFAMVGHESFMEIIWQIFKEKSWWIILVPFHTPITFLQNVETSFYSDAKNKGFILIPLMEYKTTVVFAHKSCMSDKQLQATLIKFLGKYKSYNTAAGGGSNIPSISDKRDLVVLCPFEEPETFYWIEEIEKKSFRVRDDIDTPQINPTEIPIRTNNPKVIEELMAYQPLQKLHSELLDYFMKQSTDT